MKREKGLGLCYETLLKINDGHSIERVILTVTHGLIPEDDNKMQDDDDFSLF